MNPPKQVKYSRKEFTATLNLLAVDGIAYHIADKTLVEELNSTFFKYHPVPPIYVYKVIDTTRGLVSRGYVFSTARGWGHIIRQNETSYWCPFQHPETNWGQYWTCDTRSQATARVIHQSRKSWDNATPKRETPKPRVQQIFNKPCRDREILRLPQSFTHDELKRSYRQLCLKHHPDHGGDTAKFREVHEAYKRLSLTVR
jgi:hypothetical protein